MTYIKFHILDILLLFETIAPQRPNSGQILHLLTPV